MKVRTTISLLVLAPLAAACWDERNGPVGPTVRPTSSPTAERCELRSGLAEARAEIGRLRAAVASLESSGTLTSGQARALTAHLTNALSALETGQYCPARAQLRSFREQLENLVSAGVLQAAQARPLISIVNRLLNDRLPEVLIDPTVQPSVTEVAGIDGGTPRPVARFVNADGKTVDFVANELYLASNDVSARDAFLERWNGSVVTTLDFGTIGVPDMPPVYLVRLDPGSLT